MRIRGSKVTLVWVGSGVALLLVMGALTMVWVAAGGLLRPEPIVDGAPITRWLELGQDHRCVGIPPGRALPYILRGLRARDSVLLHAELALWRCLPVRVRLRWWASGAVDAQTRRFNLLLTLRKLGPAAVKAVPDLIEMVRDPRGLNFDSSALAALGSVGSDSDAALAVEVEALRTWHRPADVLALRDFGPRAKAALPLIVHALAQPGSDMGLNACLALDAFGPAAAPAVPGLVAWLKDPGTRANALVGLEGIGPAAAPAVPELLAILEGPDRNLLGASVLQALMNIGPQASQALPLLARLQRDPDPTLRVLSAMASARIRGKPGEAVPALAAELRGGHPNGGAAVFTVRFSLSRSLGIQGFPPTLAAAWLLGDIGPDAHGARAALDEAARGPAGWLSVLAARALWRIDHDADACLPVLEAGLRAKDDQLHVVAALVLAEMGAGAKPAEPALVAACSATSWRYYYEVFKALKDIDPTAATQVFGH